MPSRSSLSPLSSSRRSLFACVMCWLCVICLCVQEIHAAEACFAAAINSLVSVVWSSDTTLHRREKGEKRWERLSHSFLSVEIWLVYFLDISFVWKSFASQIEESVSSLSNISQNSQQSKLSYLVTLSHPLTFPSSVPFKDWCPHDYLRCRIHYSRHSVVFGRLLVSNKSPILLLYPLIWPGMRGDFSNSFSIFSPFYCFPVKCGLFLACKHLSINLELSLSFLQTLPIFIILFIISSDFSERDESDVESSSDMEITREETPFNQREVYPMIQWWYCVVRCQIHRSSRSVCDALKDGICFDILSILIIVCVFTWLFSQWDVQVFCVH